MGFLRKDELVADTKALPNGAATISTDGLDLGHGDKGDFLANAEYVIESPALTTGELPDGQTLTYSIEHDTDPAFGTVAVLQASVAVITGAGGAGAAAANFAVRLPVDVKRYVRTKCVKTGAANASTKSVTGRLQF